MNFNIIVFIITLIKDELRGELNYNYDKQLILIFIILDN